MYLLILCALVCLCVCLCEGVRSPGTGVTDSFELLCGCWKLNSGPLEKQSVLITTEPSHQSPILFCLVWFGFVVLFCFVLLRQGFSV